MADFDQKTPGDEAGKLRQNSWDFKTSESPIQSQIPTGKKLKLESTAEFPTEERTRGKRIGSIIRENNEAERKKQERQNEKLVSLFKDHIDTVQHKAAFLIQQEPPTEKVSASEELKLRLDDSRRQEEYTRSTIKEVFKRHKEKKRPEILINDKPEKRELSRLEKAMAKVDSDLSAPTNYFTQKLKR